MGLMKRLVLFHVTGISYVQLRLTRGSTSTALHLITYATALLFVMT